jgi:hypothetical protein
MNDKFVKRLEEYLKSECSEDSIRWSYEWNEDTECCEVCIRDERIEALNTVLNFRYNKVENDLMVELSEDCFYTTRESNWTVKYFWMLVAPALFPV